MSRALWAIAGVTVLAAAAGGYGGRTVTQSRRIQNVAAATGVPADVMAVFSAVESRGDDSAVRFECHRWNRSRGSLPAFPCTPKSADEQWSVTASETNRAAFDRAYAISPRLAVEVSSWGRYQVLGSTALASLGWTPRQLVEAFAVAPEDVSDELVIAWFRDNPAAAAAARRRDWRRLARLYNGPGQVDYYASAMAQAWAAV